MQANMCAETHTGRHKKKLLYLSAAVIVAMLIFLTANLHSIAPPKMKSGSENLQMEVRNMSHIHNLANTYSPVKLEVMATFNYDPVKDKTLFQGEDARIDPLQEEVANTRANPSPFQREEILSSSRNLEPVKTGIITSTLQLLSTNKKSTQEVKKLHREDLPYTSGGYLLSHDYWEQLTAGSRNLFGLQCWAKRLKMSVVEPFVKKTELHSPTGDEEVKRLFRFSDIYNLDYWNALSQKANYSSLIPWEHFIGRAPRNLIAVNINYGATKQEPRQEYRYGCTSKGSWNRLVQFLEQKHKFNVVRWICINFSYNKEFSLSEFYEEVFGGNKPSDSTVLFGQWRGLSSRRIQVTGSGCETPTANLDAEPSKRVLQDAQKYTEQYLKTYNYVAIFARMEKAKQQKNQQGMVTNCFHETLESWRKMVSTTGLNTTFLSADVGRLGSGSFKMAADDLDRAFTEFFTALYGDMLTVSEWEATFENISGISHPGYIGILQKVLASQAKCVLFVGGGSFQRNALKLYRKRHAKQDWCIYIIKDCSEAKLYDT